MNALAATLLILPFYLPFLGGTLLARERAQPGRTTGRTPATLALAALVALPSLLQLAAPALLTALQRDRDLILRDGQLWRLVTALVVQDGGPIGLLFNLTALALLGTVAERLLGGRSSSSAPASSASSSASPGNRTGRATRSATSVSRWASPSSASGARAAHRPACSAARGSWPGSSSWRSATSTAARA